VRTDEGDEVPLGMTYEGDRPMRVMSCRSAGSKRPTSTAAAHTLFTSASVRTCTTHHTSASVSALRRTSV